MTEGLELYNFVNNDLLQSISSDVCHLLTLGFIHTCDLLDLNYSLNNGLYCTKWAHSHWLFGQLISGLKSFDVFLCLALTNNKVISLDKTF